MTICLRRRFHIRWDFTSGLRMARRMRNGTFTRITFRRFCGRLRCRNSWWGTSCWGIRSGILRRRARRGGCGRLRRCIIGIGGSEFGDGVKVVTTLRGVALRHAQKRRHDRRTPKWIVLVIAVGAVLSLAARGEEPAARWTEKRAAEWYSAQPWLVGSNYIPATAINELEMWQGGGVGVRG